jgi:ribosomal silencing factor RsfS
MARQSAFFERVVIASGDSNRQVNALCDQRAGRTQGAGAKIVGVEGRRNGE